MFLGGLVTFEDAQEMLRASPEVPYDKQVYRAFLGMLLIIYKLHQLHKKSPLMFGLAKSFGDAYKDKTVADLFSIPERPPSTEDTLQAIIDYWLAKPDYNDRR